MREISGVVITRNEEDRIALCLNAMGKVCTEVIVVDTDSEDQTTQIARTMGARVHAAQWLGFGQTKNLGADIATYNWILSIDADEVLSDELVQTLNKLELREDQVYALDRISNLCGKWIHHSGWYPDWIPRLYHRKKVSWDHAHVHEQLVIPHGCQVEKLNGKLFHYSYQTFEQFDEKMERYARLSARSMLEKGRPYNPLLARVSPAFRYFRTLVLKMGFLDGQEGLWLSRKNAELVHKKYEYLRKLIEAADEM